MHYLGASHTTGREGVIEGGGQRSFTGVVAFYFLCILSLSLSPSSLLLSGSLSPSCLSGWYPALRARRSISSPLFTGGETPCPSARSPATIQYTL